MNIEDHKTTAHVVPPHKRGRGPRRGEVIGERYEIRDRLREDLFSSSLLAFDQETENAALVRVVHSDLLDSDASRRQVTHRLQSAVGVGGRYLPGLSDADRDGSFVYAVEPVPNGAPLRDVMERRRHEGKTLDAHELLPVIARLAAALEAVPPPWHHGDVRASQVWVDPEQFLLTGSFLLSALPPEVVRRVLESSDDLRRRHAPEVLRGTADDAADRYGVGIIAVEALLGVPPPEPGEMVGQGLGSLGEALRALLRPDPRRRSASLDPLCEALARHAALPVPELEAVAFRRARRLSVTRPSEPALEALSPSAGLESEEPDSADLELVPRRVEARDPKTKNHVTELAGESTATDIDTEALPNLPTLTDSASETLLEIAAGEPTVEELIPSTTGETRRVVLSEAVDEPPSGAHETRAVVARTVLGAASEGTQEIDASDFMEDDEPERLDRAIEGADAEGTQEITAGQLMEHGLRHEDEGLAPRPRVSTQELTQPRLRVREESGPLDPRLVRAALDVQLEDSGEARVDGADPDSLDPRLVRAALDVQLEDSGQEALPPAPAAPAPPRERTMKIALDDIEMVPDVAPAAMAQASKARTSKPKAPQAKAPQPQAPQPRAPQARKPQARKPRPRAATPQLPSMSGVKSIPRPREASDPRLQLPAGEVLFDDSAGGAEPEVVAPVVAPVKVRSRTPEQVQVKVPSHDPRAEIPAPTSNPGRLIVAVALILGIAILAGSILFATWRREEADDREELRLQERYQQLQLEADQ